MGKEETLGLLNLQSEIDRLNKKIYFLEKENRELRREITDYTKREEELLQEISSLTSEVEELTRKSLPKLSQKVADTVEEFLLPKVKTGTGLDRSQSGIEETWSEFMYAYTDELFIESEKPDMVLYKDETDNCYRSYTGNTVLPLPILKEDLERLNILKVRHMTEEEKNDLENEIMNTKF